MPWRLRSEPTCCEPVELETQGAKARSLSSETSVRWLAPREFAGRGGPGAVVAPVVAMVAQAPARAAPARAVPLERPARAQIAIKFLAFSEWLEAEGTP